MGNAQFIPVILPDEPIGQGTGSGNVVPFLGHGAFILVDSSGDATFYEYGHFTPGATGVITTNTTGDDSNIRSQQITSGTIQFGTDGNITEASLQSALNQVFGTGGLYAGQDPGMVLATPFGLSATQYSNIAAGLNGFETDVNAGQDNYSLFGNPNCINFVYDMAGDAAGGGAPVLTISATQNWNYTTSVPSIAGDAILAQADANSIPSYQYFSPYSWNASNGQSSIQQISNLDNLTAIEDFAVQFGSALEAVGSTAGSVLNSAGSWISEQQQTITQGTTNLLELIFGSSDGDQITATLGGTQSPVALEFSNASATPVVGLTYNATGSDTLNGYNSGGTVEYSQTNSFTSGGGLGVGISGSGDDADLTDASISLAASTSATIDGGSNTITAASGDTVTVDGVGAGTGNDAVTASSCTIDVGSNTLTNIYGSSDTISGSSSDSIGITGSHDTLSTGAGTGAGVYVYGGYDTVTAGNGNYVLITGIGDGTGNDSATVSGSTVSVAAGSLANIYGSNDTISGGATDSIGITGSHDTLSTGAGTGAGVYVYGGYDTVTAGNGDYIGVTGIGDGAGNDSITVTGSTISVAAGTLTNVYGASDSISGGATDSIGVTGNYDTVNTGAGAGAGVYVYGGYDTVTAGNGDYIGVTGIGDGAGNDSITVTGSTISVAAGTLTNVYGASDSISGGATDSIGVTGNYDTVNTGAGAGAGVYAYGGYDTITAGSGDYLSLTGIGKSTGNDEVYLSHATISVASTTFTNINGTGDAIDGANNDDIGVLNAGNTVTASNGSGIWAYANGVIDASNATITISNNLNDVVINGSNDVIDAGTAVLVYEYGNNDDTYGNEDYIYGTGNDDYSFGEDDEDYDDEDYGDEGMTKGSGTGNTISTSNGTITLAAGETATVTGSSDAIQVASNDTLTMSASSSLDTITLSGQSATIIDNGGYNPVTVSGPSDTVNLSGNLLIPTLHGLLVTLNGSSEQIVLAGDSPITVGGRTSATIIGADGTLTANNAGATPKNTINWNAGGSEVQTFTRLSGGGLQESDQGYAGGNGGGTLLYQQVTTTSGGVTNSTVSGNGAVSGLCGAGITLQGAASCTLTGGENTVSLGSSDSLALQGAWGDIVTLSGSKSTLTANSTSYGNVYKLNGSGNSLTLSDGAASVTVGGSSNTVDILGEPAGSDSSIISGTGALLEFSGSSSAGVLFNSGSSGTLKLDSAAGFAGTVAGLADGDSIDLGNFLFSGAPTITGVTGSGAVGTNTDITITDGAQNATLLLLNQYANQFAVNASAYTLTAAGTGGNAGTLLELAAAH